MTNRLAICLLVAWGLVSDPILASAAEPANPAASPEATAGVSRDQGVVAATPLTAEELKASAANIQKLFAAGKYQETLDAANRYLENVAHDNAVEFTRSQALTRLGRINEAITALEALVENAPEMAAPYNNLAVLYASQGRLEDARKTLETVLLVQPNYAVAYENLGDLYTAMARQAYDRALKLDPRNALLKSKAAKLN